MYFVKVRGCYLRVLRSSGFISFSLSGKLYPIVIEQKALSLFPHPTITQALHGPATLRFMPNNKLPQMQSETVQNQEKGQKTRKALGDLRQDKSRF
jgi:hypothetical protein